MHLNLQIPNESRKQGSEFRPRVLTRSSRRCERSRSASLTFTSLSLSFFPLRSSCFLRDLVSLFSFYFFPFFLFLFFFFFFYFFFFFFFFFFLFFASANRSTFSSVLVVFPAAARFRLFSRSKMERRNGVV